jgi:hypothetical protein
MTGDASDRARERLQQLGIMLVAHVGHGCGCSIESLSSSGELPEFCSGNETNREVSQAADDLPVFGERWSR